jgi:hypothetical protein
VADERGFGEWQAGAPESARHPPAYAAAPASPPAHEWAEPSAPPADPFPEAAAAAHASAPERFTGAALDDVEELFDVEELEEEDSPAGNGFHAFLRHASLHNLLQIESLSRTTGVFLVVSGGSRGYLHLSGGDLVHAETGGLSGEEAAFEVLSWENGEFKSCTRTLAPVRTVQSSLQQLLLRLAQRTDEALEGARRQRASQVVPRPLDQDAPTETNLSPPAVPAVSLEAAGPSAVQRPSTPPPLPVEPEPVSLAEVTLSAAGEVLEGRGAVTEEFSSRVAYAARLAELIGRAIRSGTPRALELRGKRSVTAVRWQPDGNLGAALFNGSQLKR